MAFSIEKKNDIKDQGPAKTLDQHEYELNNILVKGSYKEWLLAFFSCINDGYELKKYSAGQIEIYDDINSLKMIFDHNLKASVKEV